ncbi:unnamed protein product [Acanthoscelides obtectus]|uniref:Uncharacterized protein n=1 Tax=Acanthoscelides obtectus TaxID=200917 RepID=A0A9P0L8M2_ACAOB|nr:unnamed protein product [Acanthoscelides obtectus]CAK1680617.1 hypothetical protein AOBTE_LOCUS32807 [Acanthoscelides obtectus]
MKRCITCPGPSNEEQYVHTSSTLSASESDSPAKTAGVQEHMLDKNKSNIRGERSLKKLIE